MARDVSAQLHHVNIEGDGFEHFTNFCLYKTFVTHDARKCRLRYMMQQGGVSKATKTINLSEDIFAGMDFTLRG